MGMVDPQKGPVHLRQRSGWQKASHAQSLAEVEGASRSPIRRFLQCSTGPHCAWRRGSPGGYSQHPVAVHPEVVFPLKPTGTASKTLTDIQAAVAEVKAIVADVKSQVSAAPPVQGGNAGK